ncbi:energy transducer TonB [Hymenobacter arizonensis]|uniref:TonB protein C-terminal n=1 Tax=Hymenobacter arizonensis TaxID=1227077 RepID=A0A1I6BNG2_HYMAR|nr:energy transducer TonB [Hymenobacter arizonensis]SFQ82455.1 TonB protein C-terminal [Hymenobacter arizonensis]
MNRNYAFCASLVVALMGSSALAQTPPKEPTSKPVVVRPPATEKLTPPVKPQPCRIGEITFRKEQQRRFALGLGDTPDKPPGPNQVLTYAERMPALDGEFSINAILAIINRYLVLPPNALEGRVYMRLVVDKAGRVRHPKILKGVRADVDSAVVAATRRLPRFTPGQHGGQAVNVSFVVPVSIKNEQP